MNTGNKMNTGKIFNDHFRNRDLGYKRSLCNTLLERNVGKIPVIVNFRYEDKIKYKLTSMEMKVLIDAEYTLTQMLFFLRRKIKLNSCDSCYLFVDRILVPQVMTMRDLYTKYKDKDGFLYMDLRFMETFG
jgi:GABA(A) receptor-associated protein